MSAPFTVFTGQGHDLRTFDCPIDPDKGPYKGFNDVMILRHHLYLYLRDERIVPDYAQVVWCTKRKREADRDDHYKLLHTLQISDQDIAALINGDDWTRCIENEQIPAWETLIRTDHSTRSSADQILILWPKAKQHITDVTPIPVRSGNTLETGYCSEDDLRR
jgi:hypothetical protein